MRRGWKSAALGDVCEMIKRGVAPKYVDEGGLCVINQKCIRGHAVNLELSRRHNVAAKAVPLERHIKYGDVLVNSTGTGTLGRVAQVRRRFSEPMTVDTHVTIVRPKDGMFYPEFFGYMLIKIEDEIISSGEGASGQTELPRTKLANSFYVTFAESLEEQKRIVAILDEAFAGIDTAIANTEKNLANARELFESYLNAVFNQLGDGWRTIKLAEVSGFQGGAQPPKSVFSNSPRNGYIRLLQIRDFKSDSKAVYIPESPKNRLCNENDIMIGRYGASVGQIHRGKAGAYNVALIKTIPSLELVDPNYFYYYLKSPAFQQPLMSVADRSAQAGFSKKDIETFGVPIPLFPEQKSIVATLDDLGAETQRLERIYQQKLTALAELKQSLLQKAFSGELIADAADGVDTVEAALA